MSNIESKKTPCGWSVIKDTLAWLIVKIPECLRLLAILLITLSYEASSGGLHTIIYNHKTWYSLILWILSLVISKTILKTKSISELENEIANLERKNCETEIFYFKNAKEKALKEIRIKLFDEQEVDITDYFHDLLAIIAQLNGFTAEERITIFSFDPNDDDQVIMLGRYSESRFFNWRGRGIHSVKQGSIAKALSSPHRYDYKNDFPEDEDEYIETLKNNEGMTDTNIIKNLRMKARTIGSFMLHDSQGRDQIAIMVLESRQRESKVLTKKNVQNIYNCFKKELASFAQEIIELGIVPLGNVNNDLEY